MLPGSELIGSQTAQVIIISVEGARLTAVYPTQDFLDIFK